MLTGLGIKHGEATFPLVGRTRSRFKATARQVRQHAANRFRPCTGQTLCYGKQIIINV